MVRDRGKNGDAFKDHGMRNIKESTNGHSTEKKKKNYTCAALLKNDKSMKFKYNRRNYLNLLLAFLNW